jgi:hypothetical protein
MPIYTEYMMYNVYDLSRGLMDLEGRAIDVRM